MIDNWVKDQVTLSLQLLKINMQRVCQILQRRLCVKLHELCSYTPGLRDRVTKMEYEILP